MQATMIKGEKEEFLSNFMEELYIHPNQCLYDFAKEVMQLDNESFIQCRKWAHELVQEKLCIYTDEQKTCLDLTNYGRYWMLRGGFLSFLKEAHQFKIETRNEKKKALLEDRLKLTHYRLFGFWLTLLISIIGLVSLAINMYLLLRR